MLSITCDKCGAQIGGRMFLILSKKPEEDEYQELPRLDLCDACSEEFIRYITGEEDV